MPFRSTESVRLHVRALARKAGVGRAWTHLLRHSFACNWLGETDDPVTLQTLLGHADSAMTARYVASVREASATRKQASVDLGGRIFG